MKLQKQVCTLEQAKRLKELGVKPTNTNQLNLEWYLVAEYDEEGETVIEWHDALCFNDGTHDAKCLTELPLNCTTSSGEFCDYKGGYPAYTVAELGEMLPFRVGSDYLVTWAPQGGVASHNDKWLCHYVVNELSELGGTQVVGETEAEVRAAMLIHLIENGLIEKK